MLTPDGRYTWVPSGYQLPPVLPYEEGRPIPSGYHLEERPRQGAVVTGFILTGIPYGMGLIAAFTSEFANKSAYLALPWAGPWLTLGARESRCSGSSTSTEGESDTMECAEDAMVITGLIIDGILQAVGGALLLAGYLAPSEELVRDGVAFGVVPARVGSGHGLSAIGSF